MIIVVPLSINIYWLLQLMAKFLKHILKMPYSYVTGMYVVMYVLDISVKAMPLKIKSKRINFPQSIFYVVE